MKYIFVDTNILVDLIADRKPFSNFAIDLFSQAENKKYVSENALRTILLNLLDFITVIPVNVETIKKGLKSKHKDFEDSVQIMCAYTIPEIECIVTRNPKDFIGCEIPILTPDQVVLQNNF